MAYIKSKNGNTVIVDENGLVVSGSVQELSSHPSITNTEHYEIIDAEPQHPILERIVYLEDLGA